jgi:hypothetical protein
MIGRLGLFFDKEVQRLIDSFAYCFKSVHEKPVKPLKSAVLDDGFVLT